MSTIGSLRARIVSGNVPPWLSKHVRCNYIRAAVVASPPWAWINHREAYQQLLDERDALPGHVLDHIVPLSHPSVCGLNVPWNLRVVPWLVNATKGNKWNPHQLELAL